MSSTSTERVLRPDNGRRDEMANALRALAIDGVQKANSGHPGAPMGMAEMAVALWGQHLRHNPANPHWPDRDRFVLSNGHASMLIYSLLHLTGYDLPLDELKRFRQLHSKTPGHPEVDITPGVETTTGPLGQGLTNAVGLALAEKLLGDEFNRPGHTIVDHHTYAFVGDGCLMEGISHEACSAAGAWQLGKLVVLYDDNGISIDGPVEGWFRDDTPARFRAYGWRVIDGVDGHDTAAVSAAIAQARQGSGQPTLIVCKTTIGKGSPNRAGTAKVHGEPLGADEMARTREQIDWPHAPFEVPPAVARQWNALEAGAAREAAWQRAFDAYRAEYPELAAEFLRRMAGELPAGLGATLQSALAYADAHKESVASRKASQKVLALLAPQLPELLGGSADLTGSNLTDFPGCGAVRGGQPGGRHINYGVREFGMAAVMNGIALHGGFIPYGGTFLTFSDYSRNAVRMAALMHQRVIHVFTHDSIGLGEDGPTHQPVEHTASLRLIPNNRVWRPCDMVETLVAWQAAVQRRDGPTCLILSRQNLVQVPRSAEQLAAVGRGGYVLADSQGAPQVTLLATGSEVGLALQAREKLVAQGVAARVVSMPCCEVFDAQDAAYRRAVLPRSAPVLAIEAGVTNFWRAYTGFEGDVIGIDRFGESAPAPQVYEAVGVTVARVVERASALATGATA